MNDLTANQAPTPEKIPSLSEVVRVAGVLRHQASVTGPDAFPGFTAGYDRDTQQATFTQIDGFDNWRKIIISSSSITITNMLPGKRHTEYTDGAVRIDEIYPLSPGLVDYRETQGYIRSDGTFYQQKEVKATQHPIDERTAGNLLRTLNVVQRAEPRPPRKERRWGVASAIGWILHGSQHPRPH